MIYLLYGNDGDKAREKLRHLLDNLSSRKPDASILKFDEFTFKPDELPDLIASQGLFEKKNIVVFDQVLSCDGAEAIFEQIEEVGSSENIFIFFEKGLPVKIIARFEKALAKIQKFEAPGKTKKVADFSIFSLGDALGKKDKKTLWILYNKAINEGIAPEEIHGILFWQIKSVILSSEAKSAAEAGLSPFVYRKSVSYAKNFTKDSLKNISSELVSIYHEAHRGAFEFETALEKFILSLR